MGKSLMSCFLTDGTAMQTYQFSRCCVTLWLQTVGRWVTRSRHKHAQINYGPFSPFPPNRTPFSLRSFPPFLFPLFLVSVSSFLLPPPPLSSLLLPFPPLSFTDCQQTSRQQANKRWGRHKHAQMNAVNRRTTSAWWRHRCRHDEFDVMTPPLQTWVHQRPQRHPYCASHLPPVFKTHLYRICTSHPLLSSIIVFFAFMSSPISLLR